MLEFTYEELKKAVAEGLVSEKKHPSEDLYIYNYTPKVQFDRLWNPVTLTCRGLILDGAGNIVARPFPKFFNRSEHEEQLGPLPAERFEVFDKLDGCFEGNMRLNLWEGGTITIREVVSNRIPVTLIGMDPEGNLVPTKVVDWFDNGTKNNWLKVTVDCPPSEKSGRRAGNHLKVTTNHSVYVEGSYIPAMELRPGMKMSTFDLKKEAGLEVVVESKVTVLDVAPLAPTRTNFPSGRKGFDIKTETGNYFIKGVLVHNSLGILYRSADQLCIATRGSFESEQALKATEMLRTRYSHVQWNKDITFLFEIIYPENRIVVDYGSEEKLVLLAAFWVERGNEVPYKLLKIYETLYGIPVVEKYNGIDDIDKVLALGQDNQEGFVVRFESGLRVKIKLEEYVRLHRVLTCLSPLSVWRVLSEGGSLNQFLDKVPDEFYRWLQGVKNDLETQFRQIHHKATIVWNNRPDTDDRKSLAGYFTAEAAKPYSAILFKMLDGRPYDHIIWKMIRPSNTRTFRCNNEEQ